MPSNPLIIAIFQIIFIYFLSRFTINELFYLLRIFFRREKLVFSIISIIFFPGTVIHELSHFFAATVLMLKVKEIDVFPKFEGTQIKLGSVLFEKKDVIRSLLVGLAPIVAAFIFFWFLSVFKFFNALTIYLVFSVSSTMFSSAADLQDLIFVIPLVIIVAGAFYIFNLRLNLDFTFNILGQINYFLFISIIINIVAIVTLKSLRFIFKE